MPIFDIIYNFPANEKNKKQNQRIQGSGYFPLTPVQELSLVLLRSKYFTGWHMDTICDEIIKDSAARIIESLPPREAEILRLRFGLGDDGEKTLEEVGERFKVSRERVRQLENKALRKLRKNKELKTLLSLLTND